jgi:hypothetical protein
MTHVPKGSDMNRNILRIAAGVSALAFVSGCAIGPELSVPVTKTSSDRYTLQWAHAYQGKRGIEIWGLVSRRGYAARSGHIHVEALGASGLLLGKVDSSLPMMGVRHRSGSFGARLQVADVRDVVRITVEVKARPDI